MTGGDYMDDARFEMLRLGQKGYCCSQIILRLALEAQGKEDADLILLGEYGFDLSGSRDV